MVHTIVAYRKRMAATRDEPMQDDINAFFADPTTGPSPNPPPDSMMEKMHQKVIPNPPWLMYPPGCSLRSQQMVRK
jgi:hypothetical protein